MYKFTCDVISRQTKDQNDVMQESYTTVLISNLWRAVFGDPDVVGGDSFHASVLMEQHL